MNGGGDSNEAPVKGVGACAPHELSRQNSKIEQEALDRKIKLGKAAESIVSIINNCKVTGAKCLDLSRRGISTLPEELLALTDIEVCNWLFITV